MVDLEQLKKEAETMDKDSAEKLMNECIEAGKEAVNNCEFDRAEKEYKKALYLSKKFKFDDAWDNISFLLTERGKKVIYEEFSKEISEAKLAEKKETFRESIQHYKNAIQIIEDYIDFDDAEEELRKIVEKIEKLQANL